MLQCIPKSASGRHFLGPDLVGRTWQGDDRRGWPRRANRRQMRLPLFVCWMAAGLDRRNDLLRRGRIQGATVPSLFILDAWKAFALDRARQDDRRLIRRLVRRIVGAKERG